MVGSEVIEEIQAFMAGSRWMANLTAALESKTNVALILGEIDNVATIRGMLGHVSLDGVLPLIERVLHERFGDYSVGWGTIFLILATGDEATKAAEIAESIRATVETIGATLDERFNVTMNFGVTRASSHWTKEDGFPRLLKAADEAIEFGKRKLVANRVYEPANLDTFWKTIAPKPRETLKRMNE
jgi:PleD family two-component response regulator